MAIITRMKGAIKKTIAFEPSLDQVNLLYAYSLRKIVIGYTGNAIRVRRSSDNAEQDIGFDISTSDLDTSSLTLFVGANDGFIVTWYDQKEVNDQTQSTTSRQPKIVTTGTILLENGKPAFECDGGNDILEATLDIYTSNPYADFTVINVINVQETDVGNNDHGIMSTRESGSSDFVIIAFRSTNVFRFRTNASNGGDQFTWSQSFTTFTQHITNCVYDSVGQTKYIRIDNTATESKAFTHNNNLNESQNEVRTGARDRNNHQLKLIIQEQIFYTADKNSTMTALNDNINAFYGTY